jgi:uncharacterized protein (DUF488 family)
VEGVLDVRGHPSSRKPGFSSHEIGCAAAFWGIRYTSAPRLGCSPDSRIRLRRTGDRATFRREYLRHLGRSPEVQSRLLGLVAAPALAILCTEREAEDCHRFVLAEWMEARGYEVVHL